MFPLDNAFTKGSLQKKKTTQKHMESIDSSCWGAQQQFGKTYQSHQGG